MQGYCTNTQDTREAWVTTQFVTLPLGSDGCLKKNQNRCTRLWGEKNKRLGGIKGCKVFKEKSEGYITSRNGWVALVCYITSRDGGVTQGDFRWYRCRRDPGQYSTDQSPPGLLGTYKRLDGIKGCEYRTSWHWVNSIYCTNLNRHVGTQGTDRGNIVVHNL